MMTLRRVASAAIHQPLSTGVAQRQRAERGAHTPTPSLRPWESVFAGSLGVAGLGLWTTLLVGVIAASLADPPHRQAAGKASAAVRTARVVAASWHGGTAPPRTAPTAQPKHVAAALPSTPAVTQLAAKLRAGQTVSNDELFEALLDIDAHSYIANVGGGAAPLRIGQVRARARQALARIARAVTAAGGGPAASLALAKATLHADAATRYQRAASSITEALLAKRLQCQSASLATLAVLWIAGVDAELGFLLTPSHAQPALRLRSGEFTVTEATNSAQRAWRVTPKTLAAQGAGGLWSAKAVLSASIARRLGIGAARVQQLLDEGAWHLAERSEVAATAFDLVDPWAGSAPLSLAISSDAARASVDADERKTNRDGRDEAHENAAATAACGRDNAAVHQRRRNATKTAVKLMSRASVTSNRQLFSATAPDLAAAMFVAAGRDQSSADRWHAIGFEQVRCQVESITRLAAIRRATRRCLGRLSRGGPSCATLVQQLDRLPCKGHAGWRAQLLAGRRS